MNVGEFSGSYGVISSFFSLFSPPFFCANKIIQKGREPKERFDRWEAD